MVKHLRHQSTSCDVERRHLVVGTSSHWVRAAREIIRENCCQQLQFDRVIRALELGRCREAKVVRFICCPPTAHAARSLRSAATRCHWLLMLKTRRGCHLSQFLSWWRGTLDPDQLVTDFR